MFRPFNDPTIYVKGLNTFGQQAEANARREGKEKVSLMAEEARDRAQRAREAGTPLQAAAAQVGGKRCETKPATPWWREGAFTGKPLDKPLDVRKITNVQRFLEEGH